MEKYKEMLEAKTLYGENETVRLTFPKKKSQNQGDEGCSKHPNPNPKKKGTKIYKTKLSLTSMYI